MIEINLTPGKKEGNDQLLKYASAINVKGMVFAFLILYIPEMLVENFYESQMNESNRKNSEIRSENQKLQQQLSQLKSIEDQVDEMKKLEERFSSKIGLVKEVIERRQNPVRVLKYIAENMPEDVWLEKIDFNDKQIVMEGFAKDYKVIGTYLENLKSGIFFDKDIRYDQSNKEENDKTRFEKFIITARVVRFDS